MAARPDRFARWRSLFDRSRLLAFAAGALSVLAWAPVALAPLLWLTLALLYILISRTDSVRQAAAIGLFFGLGLFLGGVSWVYVSLSVFGGMPPALAAVATFLYCLLLAAFPALAMAAFVRFRGRSVWPNVLLFAALWGLIDWMRGWVFTGFPWLALGYTQTPGDWAGAPLAGFAPVLGVYGVSVLVALLGAILGAMFGEALPPRFAARAADEDKAALTAKSCKWTQLAVATGLLLSGVLLARVEWTSPSGLPLRVALLQGNIDQDLKWSPGRFEDSLRIYHDLAQAHPAQLTILPETALPTFFDRLPANYVQAMAALAGRQNGDLVIGSVIGDQQRYTNSVVSIGAAPGQRYDKAHLVPFGEFIPPGFAWAMRWLHIPLAGFTPGTAVQAPFKLSGQQVAFNICYEDVFGEEIATVLPAATILANVSNTAWFGRSWAQPQHLQISQLRSLETGRPMLRATNTGMTAAIRPDGTVQAVLPPFSRGALVVEVQGMAGLTPFARIGNYGALLLIGLFFLAGWPQKSLKPP